MVVPYVAIVMPFIALVLYRVLKYFISSFREVIRLGSITKSPMLTFLSESILGTSTIRAFGKSEDFVERNHKLVD